MAENTVKYTQSSESPSEPFEIRKLDRQYGKLGTFFGSAENAPMYIAGIVLLSLTCAMIVFIAILLHQGKLTSDLEVILKAIIPLITLILGYLFGKKT